MASESMKAAQLALRMNRNAPRPNSKWRHFKGGEYEVLCCGVNEKTLEPEVIYYGRDMEFPAIRPLAEWLGLHETEKVRRYTPI